MAKAKVTITANNQMSKGIKAAEQELTSFQKVADKVGASLKAAFSVAAIAAAGKALVSVAKECSEAYKTQLDAETKLENALKATGKQYEVSAQSLKKYASQLQSTTRFGDDAILEAEALLVATEKLNKDGLEKTITLSADLAEAMGTDITSAAQTLSKVLQDPTKGLDRLKTIGVSFTVEEKEQIKALSEANELFKAQDLILEKVQGKYGGLAEAIASTPTGTLDKIKNVMSDIKEDLGQGIVGALAPAFEWILGALQKIHQWAADHIAEKDFYSLLEGSGTAQQIANKFSLEKMASALEEIENNYRLSLSNFEGTNWGAALKQNGQSLADIVTRSDGQIRALFERIFGKGSETEQLIESALEDINETFRPMITWQKKLYDAIDIQNGTYKLDELQRQQVLDARASSSFTFGFRETSPLEDFYNGNASHMFQLAFGTSGSPSLDAALGKAGSGTLALAIQNMAEYDPREMASAGVKELMRQRNPLVSFFADITSDSIKLSTGAPGGSPTLDAMFGRNGGFMLGNAIANRQQEDTRTDFQKLLDKLGTSDQQTAFGNTVLNSFISNIGEAGSVISKLATNMSTMGPLLGAIATALEYVFQGFGQVLRPILDEVIKYGLEPLREIGRVLADLIKPILEELMPLFRDSADSFIGAINMVGQALAPVIRLITTVISPILSQLCNTLKMIEPVISVVAKVIAWLAGTVTYVVEVFQHIGATILNWIAGFHIGNWRPFEGIRVEDKGMPGDYNSYIKSYMSGIDNASTLSVNDASTQTAVSSAAYRGATNVTINIYAEGPLVGDGGMRQFAQMIRDEFEALNYYGVTA